MVEGGKEPGFMTGLSWLVRHTSITQYLDLCPWNLNKFQLLKTRYQACKSSGILWEQKALMPCTALKALCESCYNTKQKAPWRKQLWLPTSMQGLALEDSRISCWPRVLSVQMRSSSSTGRKAGRHVVTEGAVCWDVAGHLLFSPCLLPSVLAVWHQSYSSFLTMLGPFLLSLCMVCLHCSPQRNQQVHPCSPSLC